MRYFLISFTYSVELNPVIFDSVIISIESFPSLGYIKRNIKEISGYIHGVISVMNIYEFQSEKDYKEFLTPPLA